MRSSKEHPENAPTPAPLMSTLYIADSGEIDLLAERLERAAIRTERTGDRTEEDRVRDAITATCRLSPDDLIAYAERVAWLRWAWLSPERSN